MSDKVYAIITERIVALLEKGVIPWKKPWKSHAGIPRNLATCKPYRGINLFLLHCQQYESPFWATFKQIKERNGRVKKGEKATPVVFYKKLQVEDTTAEEQKKAQDVPIKFVLRYYHVFNVAQTQGLTDVVPQFGHGGQELPSTLAAEDIISGMQDRPTIKHGYRRAFYSPQEDVIGMPNHKQFVNDGGYYSVLFHEVTHSTGHEKRLNRLSLTEKAGYGSDPYAREELIAEMGSAFLCAHAGITEMVIENQAAYIQGWTEKLQKEPLLVVQAASAAQKAADYILGNKAGGNGSGENGHVGGAS